MPASTRRTNPPPGRDFDWKPYYRIVARRPARDTLLFALEKFDDEPKPRRDRRDTYSHVLDGLVPGQLHGDPHRDWRPWRHRDRDAPADDCREQ